MIYILQSSDFPLYIEDYLMNEHTWVFVQYKKMIDLVTNVDQHDLYYGVQQFCLLS